MKRFLIPIVLTLGFLPPSALAAIVNIGWTPPSLNTDGTPLTDLAGFRVRYGTVAGAPDKVAEAGTAAQLAISIPDAEAAGNTFYFVVFTVNGAGVESDPSNAVSKTFPPPVIAYTVTTGVNLPGAGTVSGGGTYTSGATATLSAAPGAGYRFSYWTGDAAGRANPVTVTVNANKTVTANFVPVPPATYTVTTGVNLPGAGTVSGGGTYTSGATATLSAAPGAGYRFSYWTGDAAGRANPVTVTVNANKTVTANFVSIPSASCSVTTSITPLGGGTVGGGGSYPLGATATLKANPAPGYRFGGWAGDATGTDNPLALLIDRDKTVTARFTATRTYVVATWTNPEPGGAVTGGGEYPAGSKAVITANPATGYRFAGWTGNASGTANPLVMKVNRNKSVTANFSALSAIPALVGGGREAFPSPFEEDWESGIIDPAVWSAWGTPSLGVVRRDSGPGLVLSVNGPDRAGVSSQAAFPLFDVSLGLDGRISPAVTSDGAVEVGLTTSAPGTPGRFVASIGLSASASDGRCFASYSIGGEEYREEIDNEWHRYQVHLLTDGHVDFYRDGEQVYLTNLTVDLAAVPSGKVGIEGYCPVGPGLVDAVALTLPPPSPIISTNGGSGFTTTVNPVSLAGTASSCESLWLDDALVLQALAEAPAWALSAALTGGENLLAVTTRDRFANESNQATLSVVLQAAPAGDGGTAPEGALGQKGGCFIATAAYGSYEAPAVKMLRRFRDEVLLASPAGEWLVAAYYRTSPPIADWIGERETARGVVRLLLLPLIVAAWLALHPAWLVLMLPPLAFLLLPRGGARNPR